MPAKKIKSVKDLTPDQRNANAGTVRGTAMVEDSLRLYGAGRSILTDKDGNVIAGNKTLEAAVDIGLPIQVVQTDGKTLVVVQRTDVDLNSVQGRELAIADNRANEVSLAWDANVLFELQAEGVGLDKFFNQDELDALLKSIININGNGEAEQPEYEFAYCCPKCGHKWIGNPS